MAVLEEHPVSSGAAVRDHLFGLGGLALSKRDHFLTFTHVGGLAESEEAGNGVGSGGQHKDEGRLV